MGFFELFKECPMENENGEIQTFVFQHFLSNTKKLYLKITQIGTFIIKGKHWRE